MKIRASQINPCDACTDMHIKDAGRGADLGSAQPDRGLPGGVFIQAEKAALELAEQGDCTTSHEIT